MRNFLLSLVMICFASLLCAQSTIAFQGFEIGDTWSISANSDAANISSVSGMADTPSDQRIRSGLSSYQGNNESAFIELAPQVVSNYTNTKFTMYVSSTAATSGNGADTGDEISVYISLDGGSTYPSTPDILISGNNNAKWAYNSNLIASTSAGTPATFQAPQGGTDINNYSVIEISIPDGTIAISVRIELDNNSSNEFWNIDDLELTGTLSNAAIVGFDAASSAENETNTPFNVDVPVTLSNYQGSPVDLTINVTGGSAEMTDYMLNTTSLSFTGDGSQNVSLTLNDDAGFDDETIELTISETTTTGALISVGTHIITLVDDEEPPIPNVRINEVDADTPGDESTEFIELFGSANTDLTGFIVVLFNGNGDISTRTIDLTAQVLDENGYFIIGGQNAPGNPEITFPNGTIQNGADAVALYFTSASNFPNGSTPTTTNLVDALVYDTDDSDDTGLLTGLGQTEQINENANGMREQESIQRGSWVVAEPTPRGATIVPVTLSSFEGKLKGNVTLLHWTTASEINNDFFEVQRSTDHQNFETIGKVKGNETTSQEHVYEFTDRNPASGINYYRLAQYDFNGDMEYHKVISVELRGNNTQIYPTLTADLINVEIGAPSVVHILTMDGKLIAIHNLEQSDRLDVSKLPAGLYYLRVQTNGNLETHRFIKK